MRLWSMILLGIFVGIIIQAQHAFSQDVSAESEQKKGLMKGIERTAQKLERLAQKYDRKYANLTEKLQRSNRELSKLKLEALINTKKKNAYTQIYNLELKNTLDKSSSVSANTARNIRLLAKNLKLATKGTSYFEYSNQVQHFIKEELARVDDAEQVWVHAGIPLGFSVLEEKMCKFPLNLPCLAAWALNFGGSRYVQTFEGVRLMKEPIDDRLRLHRKFVESIGSVGFQDGQRQQKKSMGKLDSWIRDHYKLDRKWYFSTKKSIEELFGTSQPAPKLKQKSQIQIWLRDNVYHPGFSGVETELLAELNEVVDFFHCIEQSINDVGCQKTGKLDEVIEITKKAYLDAYNVGLINGLQEELRKDRQKYLTAIRDTLQCLKPKLSQCAEDEPNQKHSFPAGENGDPHLTTFDQYKYDFQGVGEFVLVQSKQDNLEIQARMAPWRNSEAVSVVTGLAMQIGADKVGVYLEKGSVLYVNDEVKMFDSKLSLPGGGRIEKKGGYIFVIWPDGSRIRIRINAGYIDSKVWLADSHRSQISGLYGNYDGDPSNDLIAKLDESDNEDVVDKVEVKTSEQQIYYLYKVFGFSWRVSQKQSLFHYKEGESTESFTDMNFPSSITTIASLPTGVREEAESICRGAGITDHDLLKGCILDVGVTGDKSFVESTLSAANDFGGLLFWEDIVDKEFLQNDDDEFSMQQVESGFGDSNDFGDVDDSVDDLMGGKNDDEIPGFD